MHIGRFGMWAACLLFAVPFVGFPIALVTSYDRLHLSVTLFALVPILAFAWNAYWFMFRFSYEITFDGEHLRWYTPASAGAIAVEDISSINPFLFNAHKFSATAGQKPVIVLNNRGLRIFIEQIVSTRADDFPVRLSNVLRLSELPLGKSRFTIGD